MYACWKQPLYHQIVLVRDTASIASRVSQAFPLHLAYWNIFTIITDALMWRNNSEVSWLPYSPIRNVIAVSDAATHFCEVLESDTCKIPEQQIGNFTFNLLEDIISWIVFHIKWINTPQYYIEKVGFLLYSYCLTVFLLTHCFLNPFPAKDNYICSWQKLHFFKEGAGA